MRTHYAHYGEWGGERVNCNRYFTTDVKHTEDVNEVTCEYCIRSLTSKK